MKLMTTTIVTVDGVMQGLGGSDEDRRGGCSSAGQYLHAIGAHHGVERRVWWTLA